MQGRFVSGFASGQLPVLGIIAVDVDTVTLHQEHTTSHLTEVVEGGLRLGNLHNAQVLLLRKNVNGAIFVGGSQNSFGEDVDDILGHLAGDLGIGGDNATKGGYRVAGMRLTVGISNGFSRDSNATGVGVLDNSNADALMVMGGTPGGVRIHVVVVAHGLAMQLLCLGNTRVSVIQIEGCGLVRVLAVAEHITTHEGGTFPDGEFSLALVVLGFGGGSGLFPKLLAEPGGDGDIVGGGVAEGVGGKLGALFESETAVLHCGKDVLVAGRINHNGNGRVILSSCTHHRRATDINLLDAGVEGGTGCHSGFEGVKVNNDQLECLDTEFGKLRHVLLFTSICQDAGMDTRVESLHAAFEALREPSEFIDGGDGYTSVGDTTCGGAGRDNLYTGLMQSLGKFFESGLVVDADQSALDGLTRIRH